jgi:hypothetical protein
MGLEKGAEHRVHKNKRIKELRAGDGWVWMSSAVTGCTMYGQLLLNGIVGNAHR